MHDKKTWQQMEQIEKALGKKIIRVETGDLDDMEEVSHDTEITWFHADSPIYPTANEEGTEVVS